MLTAVSCRNDEVIVLPDHHETGDTTSGSIVGMYVLNEGNMGSNKATLDYLDLTTGSYSRNIYPSRNPSQVMELGDVGNDIKIYGSRLWMVINQSNKVEVARADDAVSIGHVDIPNCRYLAFDGGYAYVSSYVGPLRGQSVLGQVYKVDTTSLQVVATCTVGYQPEEMAIVESRLYVANSGGYSALQGMGYDRTVSVIDLRSFQVINTIDVAPNLFHIRADKYGTLWVSSRGDYGSTPSRLYEIYNDRVTDSIDTPVDGFDILGDSLVYYGNKQYGVIDLRTGQIINSNFLNSQSSNIKPQTPYGIIINPETGNVYIMDATNYVSSGKLFCFDRNGNYKWSTWTGDIPGHACFTGKGTGGTTPSYEDHNSAYIDGVDEYMPAPGQFVNTLPEIDDDDNADSAAVKATKAIAGRMDGLITLGAYGGYVTFHFDHSVRNLDGNDLMIRGNAFAGNSEPGIVMVSVDSNHNGIPDDEWYELSGSADTDSAGKVVYNYQITYTPAPMADIPWTDNQGSSGLVYRNNYHTQEYFPLWIHEPLTFTGTLLPKNGHRSREAGITYWNLDSFAWGYVDNDNTDESCSFDISNAVDRNRQPVSLESIDFVRVYSAENQYCGWLGETSTEVAGAMDLHVTSK